MVYRKVSFGLWMLCVGLGGCTTSTHLKKVALVSYTDDASNGKSVGTVTGEDCSWVILGNKLGTADITRAINKARTGSTDYRTGDLQVDYLRNVYSQTRHSNYILVSKSCYEVSGTGYQKK
ncbi:MAG: hypothetical protein ACOH5I_23135 [Oligoflexus sp.]